MNCPSKACVKSTNLNAHLHCLNTISIEILLISLRFQRQILGNIPATDDLLSQAYRLKTAPVAAFYAIYDTKRIRPFAS